MTKDEAINWIINISADIGKAEHSDLWHYEQALSEIRDMLESAQPEPQWIPYSSAERPKDREEVMVTIDDGYKRYTDTDEYVDGKFWYHDENNVVAWKPFDEPWEGEQP